jgi:hypothetical protein
MVTNSEGFQRKRSWPNRVAIQFLHVTLHLYFYILNIHRYLHSYVTWFQKDFCLHLQCGAAFFPESGGMCLPTKLYVVITQKTLTLISMLLFPVLNSPDLENHKAFNHLTNSTAANSEYNYSYVHVVNFGFGFTWS